MNLRAVRNQIHKFGKLTYKLRTVLIIQGVLWIIAGISLSIISGAGLMKMLLMFGLGIAFIGWGYSLERGKWWGDPYMAQTDFERHMDAPDEIKYYSL